MSTTDIDWTCHIECYGCGKIVHTDDAIPDCDSYQSWCEDCAEQHTCLFLECGE